MGSKALTSAAALLAVFTFSCGLSSEECLKLRGDAYQVVNEAHTCNDDGDCHQSEWPGCAKPISSKNKARVDVHQAKYDKGGCTDDEDSCSQPPEVYCKQGLCVFRYLAGDKKAN